VQLTVTRRRSPATRGRGAGVLRVPPEYGVQRLGDPASRDAVARWLRGSADHTLYHLGPYLDFIRTQDRNAEVFLISRDGAAQFALPVHSWSGRLLESAYSGVVFPPTRSERTLRRSVAALAALLSANRHLLVRLQQSAQAPAYDDHGRTTLLQRLIEGEGLALQPIYARLCDLEQLTAPAEIPVAPGSDRGALAIDPDWLGSDALVTYDPDVRNQIRQALRHGLTVEYARGGDPDALAGAYARFQPVHEQSWRRTGLLPKPSDYWPRLSDAIRAAGGEDLVVLVLDPAGEPLAGVVCHAYQARAIYWSGCSSQKGLRLRANPLCLHGAIAACRQLGVRTFELGRFRAGEASRKERAVTDYKAQFGGELVRVTTFASAPSAYARARVAQAGAVSETRRRLAVELVRVRARARSKRALPVPVPAPRAPQQ
jgi:Acetyltransferase (GNAT) domain